MLRRGPCARASARRRARHCHRPPCPSPPTRTQINANDGSVGAMVEATARNIYQEDLQSVCFFCCLCVGVWGVGRWGGGVGGGEAMLASREEVGRLAQEEGSHSGQPHCRHITACMTHRHLLAPRPA